MKIKSSKNQYEMQDLTTQYPQSEFPDQTQSVSGLAKDRDPKPDHGEEKYQGFGRLKGRKALITGADSGIGRAAAIAFAREGADVALSHLASGEPDAQEVVALIENDGQEAFALTGDIQDESFCKQLINDPSYGVAVSTDHKLTIFPGEIPLKAGDRFIGAVGVSGGKPDQDHSVAEAGAEAFAAEDDN